MKANEPIDKATPAEHARKPHMLVVDDEPDVGEFIAEVARMAGYRCTCTSHPEQFVDHLEPDVSLIMLDLVMPGTDGIELLRILAERECAASVILMSGYDRRVLGTAEELARTLGLRVLGQLQKPIRLATLEDLLAQSLASGAGARGKPESSEAISERDLRCAVDEDQFVLHYQTQVDMAHGDVIGMEALVRWQHPQRGLILPDHFIGLAENLGLIDALGWMVMRKGMADLHRFAGVRPDLTLSLNVSAFSLHDLDMPDRVISLVREHVVQPSSIVLEITESGLARELAKAMDILTRLRVKRVQLAIDDFGTGYSMMQQLRRVPATEIKVDMGFVQAMLRDESARVVVEKTIELGHELGMRVVAEGVETAAQLSFLREAGCDVVQGYLYSRPVPADVLIRQLLP